MSRSRFWLALQAAGSLALLAVLFRRFDWPALASALGSVSLALYLGSLAAVVAGQLLFAYRWRVVLASLDVRVGYREVLRQYLVGLMFSNVLPTAVGGDAAKVYYLGKAAGYMEVGASVFVDRFLGFLWLSVMGAVLAWQVTEASPLFVLSRNLLTLFALSCAGLVVAARFVPLAFLAAARDGAVRRAGTRQRAAEFLRQIRAAAARVDTLAVSAFATAAYLALLAVVYRRYFAAAGATVPDAVAVMNVLAGMAVFVNVPISMNGIGLREQLHYLLFAALGVPKAVAVSVSLLMFSHVLLLSLAGYVAWIRWRPAAAA